MMRRLGLALVLAVDPSTSSTKAMDAADFSFLVMGDWGGSSKPPFTTSAETRAAWAMAQVGTQRNASLVLAVGDNFYREGIPNDPNAAAARFKSTFEDVFPATLDDFRLCAGNHDHYGNVSAQVQYSAQSLRWNFPALFHDFVRTAGGGLTVHFIMLDTVVLAGHSGHDASSEGHDFNRHRGQHSLDGSDLNGPVGPAHAGLAVAQWAWLEQTLNSSTADFIVVAGHYPIWSVCEHGPTAKLMSTLRPLLNAYGVDAYLAGHDHCAQHISDASGVEHHGVGAFHGCVSSRKHAHAVAAAPGATECFHWGRGTNPRVIDTSHGAFAFATISAANRTLAIDHIGGHGKRLYSAAPKFPRAKPQQAVRP